MLAETLAAGGVSLVSGGTDNHLMLVDVTALGVGGKVAEEVLGTCGITVNKNMIPFDERKPMDPSGIRIGTPALTSRNMGEDEMRKVGQWILQALRSSEDAKEIERIRGEVRTLCESFPVPAAALDESIGECLNVNLTPEDMEIADRMPLVFDCPFVITK